ncbi:unnamed protein product [Allacma fusca]|uniref:Uncharacterized protein n=1 Tax=Allacma fusca TaxID=39272 RepID=A0A8J2JQP6_9HEXA|nr:unnamed protein product [Allacma fusca]
MYPVLAAPVPMEEHLLPQNYKGVEPMEVTPASTTGGGNPTVNSAAESGKTEPDGVGATTTSKDPNNSQNPTAPVTSTDEANNGSSNSATTTTAHSDTTTTSVPAVLPPPPIAHPVAVPHMGMPPPPGGHPGHHLQPHHPHAHHIPPGAGGPGSGYMPTAASSHHGTNHGMPALHPQHHLNSVPGPFIYPHPAGFVYGPPIFHGK